MTRAKAEAPDEKPGAGSKGRGRKSREYDGGASGVTATTETYWPEAGERLMEEIVNRANSESAGNGDIEGHSTIDREKSLCVPWSPFISPTH